MPPWYNFIWCPCKREFGERDNCYEDPFEKRRVLDELDKVIKGAKNKYFADENINI